LANFRATTGDLRKLNSPRPHEIWTKLASTEPSDKLARMKVWSMGKDKVQILVCPDKQKINMPVTIKFGILYDGFYNGEQLNWKCSFVADQEPSSSLLAFLPDNCRNHVVSDGLMCD
jgi:hypothetical protein